MLHEQSSSADKPTLTNYPVLWLKDQITPLTAQERERFQHAADFNKRGTGYYVEQSTTPQTIGYSLADSPVGLLAWIYEKLILWTDHYPWTDDEGDGASPMALCVSLKFCIIIVLTWISIYWFSRAGPAASLRIYFEFQTDEGQADWADTKISPIPFGVSLFPADHIAVRDL